MERNNYEYDRGRIDYGSGLHLLIGTFDVATVDLDSVFIRNNQLEGSLSLLEVQGPGTIRHLFVEDNYCGPSIGEFGSVVRIEHCSIRDSYFRNNTVELWNQWNSDPYSRGGSLLVHRLSDEDSIVVANLEFSNNTYLDPDDYSLEQLTVDLQAQDFSIYPTNGRVYHGSFVGQPSYYRMDSCQFVDNFCPVILPEVNMAFGGKKVGSTVRIGDNDSDDAEGTVCILQNLRFENCDDGALEVLNPAETLHIRNVKIIDCNRMGMAVKNYNGPNMSTRIKNVYVRNLQKQWAFMTSPWPWSVQSPLIFGSREENGAEVSNMTVIDSDVVLLSGCYHLDGAHHRMRNSLFWNNSFESSYSPAITDWDYSHCLLPEERPGPGNLLEVDPLFETELGQPWLSAASPLIDAGSPDSVYNDMEDPANPGFALWPSQGGLRNDIGYTGGPHAATLDHLVGITPPREDAFTRPGELRLEPAWPNPFNPSTQLRFHLPHSAAAQLAVYNLRGQRVRVLHEGPLPAGEHEARFHGGELASGVYIVRLEAEGTAVSRKVLLLK